MARTTPPSTHDTAMNRHGSNGSNAGAKPGRAARSRAKALDFGIPNPTNLQRIPKARLVIPHAAGRQTWRRRDSSKPHPDSPTHQQKMGLTPQYPCQQDRTAGRRLLDVCIQYGVCIQDTRPQCATATSATATVIVAADGGCAQAFGPLQLGSGQYSVSRTCQRRPWVGGASSPSCPCEALSRRRL